MMELTSSCGINREKITYLRHGTYRKRPIIAYTIEGTNVVQRFQYVDSPYNWYFPLTENGENVDKHMFKFE